MSRITDLAAVLNVLSKVATKNAALRQAAGEQKWKTSSIMREVGNERQSYDTFYTDNVSQESQAESASKDDMVWTSANIMPESSASTATMGTSSDQKEAHVPDADISFTTAPPLETETHAPTDAEDDLLLLRQARRVPKLGAKTAAAGSTFERRQRDNPDFLRPSQADRFDVRSSGATLELKKEQAKWRPQTAIDTQFTRTEENDSGQAVKHEQQKDETAQLITNAGEVKVQGQSDIEKPLERHEALRNLSSSKVPSSRLSRLYHYGTLGASLGFNAFADSTKRLFNGPSSTTGNGFLSDKNTDLLVRKLSRMRGAALKLGQMISFQDENLPGPIREVLQRVQDSADYMPASQLNKVMSTEFGSEWRSLFAEFNDVPIAAASIGQVHKAKLHDGRKVAVKVQYPGVANSISSDLRNLSLFLTASRLLPKGLYLDKTIENARTELGWECDYVREAENTKRFRELVGKDDTFTIPQVIDECSGQQVITTEFLDGAGIAKSQTYSQELRDFLGTQIMRLCLRELAEFRFMQTDPNWTNFLYNKRTHKIELLDFGACRSFDESFISKYCELLVAAAQGDKSKLQQLSQDLGYLTGSESSAMIDAHISSILTLSEPFSMSSASEIYDFKDQTITERVKSFIPVMLRERLSPPPEETYSLHRRLSGHFLLCARMKSRIPCKAIFKDVMTKAGYMKPST